MGKELVSSYMRRKLSSILEEAEAEADSGSSSSIILRVKSLKDSSPVIPADRLQELIELVSEFRVFSYTAAVSKKGCWLGFPKLLLHPLSRFMFNRRMRFRLDSIERMLIGNPPPPFAPPAAATRRVLTEQTRPIEEEDLSHIIGFEAEADKIEAWLVRGEEAGAWRAVGIVGRCGCGKTALAQKVFASPTVVKEFSPRIWVCLSSMQLNEERADPWPRIASLILREISNIDDDDDDSSLPKLRETLKGKRYLIVLDDAWPLDQGGESLIFPKESGGAVIVTTRLRKSIGDLVGDDKEEEEEVILRVEPQLSHEICLQIFSQALRRHGNFDADLIKHAIRGDIERNIDRLPLAAKTLGKILPALLLKTCWIRARDMTIIWGNDTRYWKWTFLPPPQQEEEVAELLKVCWLDVSVNVNMNKFLIVAKYSAYLVYKLHRNSKNLKTGNGRLKIFHQGNQKTDIQIPVKIKYLQEENEEEEEEENEEEEEENLVHFPQAREGEEGTQGWREIKVGEFTTSLEDDGRWIQTGLEVLTPYWKSGLVVKGIEIRPNYPLEF